MIKFAFVQCYFSFRVHMELETFSEGTSTEILLCMQERIMTAWISDILVGDGEKLPDLRVSNRKIERTCKQFKERM